MASKLEKHEKFIVAQLAQRCSYASIAKSLTDLGCKTSPQNVFSWARNRASKLQARQALVNPLPSTALPAAATTKSMPLPDASPLSVVSPNIPNLGRSASISKKEPTEVEIKMAALMDKASSSQSLDWKK